MLRDVKSRQLCEKSVLKVKMFENNDDFILEQDNASSHDARFTQEWLEEKHVLVLRK